MIRRAFLSRVVFATGGIALGADTRPASDGIAGSGGTGNATADAVPAKDWLARWEKNILGDARNRYCDREMGEEIGWLVSPFLDGFLYGYQVTRDVKWVEHLADWADSWIRRGVKEPDGFIGLSLIHI